MPYCGFCGKLCPTAHGLKRHINGTPDCKKASSEEFSQYANGIWDDVPENIDRVEQRRLPNLPIHPDLPDFHLEEDIQIAEEMFYDEQTNIPLPLPPQHDEPQPHPQHATVEIIPDNEAIDGSRYIENFPEQYMAGATWGKGKPLFEYLVTEQNKEGGSRWAPFEDEDEWQLAEWLIRNVGQKQTDAFLKLPIVRVFFFFFVNILSINRLKNVHNPPMGVIRAS